VGASHQTGVDGAGGGFAAAGGVGSSAMSWHVDERFDENVPHDFAHASRYEWLETDGLGGWASSTVSSPTPAATRAAGRGD